MAYTYVPYDGPVVTHADAKAAGLKRYFTGKPCKEGHVSQRFIAGRCCVDCRNYRLSLMSPEEKLAQSVYQAAYNAENAELRSVKSKLYYISHRDECLVRSSRNQKNNRPVANEAAARSRARTKAKKVADLDTQRKAIEVELGRPIITRKEAKKQGLPRYFTGIPCKMGHLEERYTKSPSCVTCRRIVTNAWIKANPDQVRTTTLIWTISNPEKVRAYGENYRAKRTAGGTHTGSEIEWLFKIQGNKCAHSWCRVSLKTNFEVDHKIPIFLRGSNTRNNLQLLCRRCNRRKSKSHPIDYARKHGMLL